LTPELWKSNTEYLQSQATFTQDDISAAEEVTFGENDALPIRRVLRAEDGNGQN
jgi:hypothetical protein